jgi:ATP-dependent exoDNAse (exonuclease V) beta subunit
LGSLWRARRERFDAASEAKWTRSPTGDMKEKPRPRDEGELPGSSVGALVGKLCHRALETWDFKKPGDAAQTVAAAARALSKLEPASDWPSAQEEAAALLTAFAGSKAARELAGVEIIGRELPFAFGKDGAVLRGSIDLLYRDGRKVVIADYKTDRVDGKSVAAVKKRYESQGAAYRDAVAKAMGLADAEFRLIFLRAPELK